MCPLIDKSMAGYENAGDEWKFVLPDTYETYSAKKKLKEQLSRADEVGFTGYGEYADVYESPDATAEEVVVMTSRLKQAITDWQSSSDTGEPRGFYQCDSQQFIYRWYEWLGYCG